MILSQKNIEEIAVAVIRDFQKSFFGSEADDSTRFALPTPIDQFASDYLNLKVSFQKLSSDGSIYGLTLCGINPIKNESEYRTSPHTAETRMTSKTLTTDDMSNSYP